MTGPGLEALASIIDAHEAGVEAQDRDPFNALDDQSHREIRVQPSVGYVWELVHDIKAHIDRIRMLSRDLSS